MSTSFLLYPGFLVIKLIALFVDAKPFGVTHVLATLMLWLAYALVARWFGSLGRARAIPLGFFLLAGYLLVTAWSIVQLAQYNRKYGGWFWTNRFFVSPVILYLLPVVVTFIGTHSRPWRSRIWVILITASITLGLIALWNSRPQLTPERRMNYSLNVVGGQSNDIELQLDLKYRLQMTNYPLEFRAMGTGAGDNTMQKLTVIRRTADFNPTSKMFLNVDGQNIEIMMWPINQPDGSSRLEFTGKENYSEIANWRVSLNSDLPRALLNAHHVEVDWGNFHASLSEAQLTSIQTFIRDWGKVLAEEGAVCTNPECRQSSRAAK